MKQTKEVRRKTYLDKQKQGQAIAPRLSEAL
jgi:hypothetical protein